MVTDARGMGPSFVVRCCPGFGVGVDLGGGEGIDALLVGRVLCKPRLIGWLARPSIVGYFFFASEGSRQAGVGHVETVH